MNISITNSLRLSWSDLALLPGGQYASSLGMNNRSLGSLGRRRRPGEEMPMQALGSVRQFPAVNANNSKRYEITFKECSSTRTGAGRVGAQLIDYAAVLRSNLHCHRVARHLARGTCGGSAVV